LVRNPGVLKYVPILAPGACKSKQKRAEHPERRPSDDFAMLEVASLQHREIV